MISPVTVTILPGTGLPLTDAPTVVAVQGSEGFSPSVPMGVSHPPSGTISGWRTPDDFAPAAFFSPAFFSSAAVSVNASAMVMIDAKSDFRNIVLLELNSTDRKAYFTHKLRDEENGDRLSVFRRWRCRLVRALPAYEIDTF